MTKAAMAPTVLHIMSAMLVSATPLVHYSLAAVELSE